MAYETVTYEVRDRVGYITLNRPQVLNAINRQMKIDLVAALDQAEADSEANVVVLRGAGRSFSAGVDLKELAVDPWEQNATGWRWHLNGMLGLTWKVWSLSKPVITAVSGHALGGGCDLALAGDITVAADDAQFGEPEVRGISGPPTLLMPWVVGIKQAKELLFFGDSVNAEEAFRLGIANRVFPRDSFEAEVHAYAKRLAAIPPVALTLNKRSINKTFELMGIKDALDFNHEVMISVALSKKPSTSEGAAKLIQEQGLKAFLAQRDKNISAAGK
jgi:enoyl-CoA hydratase/carnithine racemase